MTKDELKDYLIDECEYSFEEVEEMSDYEMFDNYLTYNGIIGYTDDIVSVYKAAFGENK